MARHSSHQPHSSKTWATSITTPTPSSNVRPGFPSHRPIFSNQSRQKSSSKPFSRPKALSKTIAFFKQRFWTISSANHFSEDELPSPKPLTTGAYIPRHAASDFSKNASRSQHRRSVLNYRVSMIENRQSVIFEHDDDESTLCSLNDDRRNKNKRRSRVINHALSSSSQTPLPPDEFAAFLAQAESIDRLRRVSAWAEIERYSPNSERRSTYVVASTDGNEQHRNSFLTQQIAKYIRPGTGEER